LFFLRISLNLKKVTKRKIIGIKALKNAAFGDRVGRFMELSMREKRE